MKYEEAKKLAVEEGTVRRNKSRRVIQQATIWTGIVVLAILFTWLPTGPLQTYVKEETSPQAAVRQQAPILPSATSPEETWPELLVPASGKSGLVHTPVGMHIVVKGKGGFRVYNVYVGERECAFGEPCEPGALLGNYVRNETTQTFSVIYAFAPDIRF